MTKLEELEVKFGGLAGINVPSIKKLKLISVDAEIDPNFFVIHRNIEELVLENVFNITNQLLEVITTNLKHLRVLRILGDNRLTAEAFPSIAKNCTRLRVLEMTTWIQKFRKSDWECLHNLTGLAIYDEKF